MPINIGRKDHNTERSANFFAAAGSAILLSFARVYPELWFISLFALVPFLWRLCHVSLKGAIFLGLMLATFFVCATSVSDLVFAPKLFPLKLFALNLVFTAFALIINSTRKYLGFDPLFIALLWCPLEYVLTEYAGFGTIFSISNSGSSLVIGFCSLFGILLGSLAIVLGNSLLVLILIYVGQWILASNRLLTVRDKKCHDLFCEVILERSWYSFPDVCDPPLHTCNQNK
jgi:hypothetical protein